MSGAAGGAVGVAKGQQSSRLRPTRATRNIEQGAARSGRRTGRPHAPPAAPFRLHMSGRREAALAHNDDGSPMGEALSLPDAWSAWGPPVTLGDVLEDHSRPFTVGTLTGILPSWATFLPGPHYGDLDPRALWLANEVRQGRIAGDGFPEGARAVSDGRRPIGRAEAEHVQFDVDRNRADIGPSGNVETFHHVRVWRMPAAAKPMDAARTLHVGPAEDRERKRAKCVAELRRIAALSPNDPTCNRQQLKDHLLRTIWPDMPDKLYEDIRREAFTPDYPEWTRPGARTRR